MGRIVLVGRLAVRDLRRRRIETALLLLAMVATTTALTLGLVLRDAADDPYLRTRSATNGPDVVASVAPRPSGPGRDPAEAVLDRPADPTVLDELAAAPGVVDRSGPYPVTAAELSAGGRTSDVQAVGRDAAPASVDQPAVVQGGWVGDGRAVVEAAFAEALDVQVGDTLTLNDRTFDVAGIAVTAAMAPYPESSCLVPCASGVTADQRVDLPPGLLVNPGLVWLTVADVRRVAPDPDSLSYLTNLKLAQPDRAEVFVDAHVPDGPDGPGLESWQNVRDEATQRARDAQILLMVGAWLLGLLAVASVSVLVGGRMAGQTRRVGLLKAVGASPGLVAGVLLAQYVLVAVVASAAGLASGALTAPLLTRSGGGLLGGAGTPSITAPTIGVVIAVGLAVAVVATAVPAGRAARTSTVDALADAARAPRRTGWLVAVSAQLPVPLLLALRVAARRPRRVVLGVVSIAVSVSGLYVALIFDAFLSNQTLAGGLADPQREQLRQVLLVVMAMVVVLAAVNAVFITWATVLDDRHSSALARALGASPGEVSAALAAAQTLPALAGALLGVFPGGFALFHAITAITGGESDGVPLPSFWQLCALVIGTVVVVAVLAAVPARLGGRRPVTDTLRAQAA